MIYWDYRVDLKHQTFIKKFLKRNLIKIIFLYQNNSEMKDNLMIISKEIIILVDKFTQNPII